MNELYVFNSKGDTIYPESNFFTINYCCDTIKLGTTFKAKIELKAPSVPNCLMVVYFTIPKDTSFVKRSISKNYIVNYDYIPKDTGRFQMKGYIQEIEMKKGMSDTSKSNGRFIYFIVTPKFRTTVLIK